MGRKLILPSLRKKVYLSVFFPLAVVLLASVVMLMFSGERGVSLLLGGIVWVVPQGYVAVRLFHRIETDPKRFMAAFYKSELLKLALAAFLFIAVMKWIPLQVIYFLGGYFCAQVVFWILMSITS
jgi:ATP synthase protein I